MSVSDLSVSTQNYLKAVWAISEWSNEPVTVTPLAERTGRRPSSVSDAVRKLAKLNLVTYTRYGAIELTELGREYALSMVRRHRLLETFLVTALGYTWDEVHEEAEHLEHAASDLLVARIDKYLGFPERDPHGDPIPNVDGQMTAPDAHQLTTIGTGKKVTVERISDADPQLLQFFAERDIVVGASLYVSSGPEFSEAIEVRAAGSERPVVLGRLATDALFVSVRSAD